MINFSEIKVFEQLEFDRIFLIFKLFDVQIGQISFRRSLQNFFYVEISDFEVKEDLRGRKIGSYILQTCIDWLNKLELDLDYVAYVNVYSENIFLRHGFKETVNKYFKGSRIYKQVIYKNNQVENQ